jgi:hypothetical protein
MAARKSAKREREAIAEPTTAHTVETTPSERQQVTEAVRARVWEMHLRGVPKVRIATDVSLHRVTVAKIITSCYAEVASERKISPARKLDAAVARMRRIQEQAWDDHDADDERERQVLEMSLAQAQNQLPLDASADGSDAYRTQAHVDGKSDSKPDRAHSDASDAKSRHNSPPAGNGSSVSIRYQSQRSQYLRIILDAEKEIARLEGLYESLLNIDVGVSVTFVKLTPEDVQRDSQIAQNRQIATVATHRAIAAPSGNPAGGESGGEA